MTYFVNDEDLMSILDSYTLMLENEIESKKHNHNCATEFSEIDESALDAMVKSMSKDDIVRFAQAQAQQDAKELASAREQEYAYRLLKKSKSKALSVIKEKIQMAKKGKMRVVEHYLCDLCDNVIENPEGGFIVHGNIYVADPSVRGGLIGNNFPEGDEKFNIENINQTVMCRKCFCETLEIPFPTKPIIKR